MRISDWSSDVCSSDLQTAADKKQRSGHRPWRRSMVKAHRVIGDGNLVADVPRTRTLARTTMLPALLLALFAARPATAQTPLTTPADAPSSEERRVRERVCQYV